MLSVHVLEDGVEGVSRWPTVLYGLTVSLLGCEFSLDAFLCDGVCIEGVCMPLFSICSLFSWWRDAVVQSDDAYLKIDVTDDWKPWHVTCVLWVLLGDWAFDCLLLLLMWVVHVMFLWKMFPKNWLRWVLIHDHLPVVISAQMGWPTQACRFLCTHAVKYLECL